MVIPAPAEEELAVTDARRAVSDVANEEETLETVPARVVTAAPAEELLAVTVLLMLSNLSAAEEE